MWASTECLGEHVYTYRLQYICGLHLTSHFGLSLSIQIETFSLSLQLREGQERGEGTTAESEGTSCFRQGQLHIHVPHFTAVHVYIFTIANQCYV